MSLALPRTRVPLVEPYRSVYIHVPFCRHRCGYCDFTLVAGRDDLIPAYLSALNRELDRITAPIEIDTLFLGGGTPTHLPPAQLEELFSILLRRFSLSTKAEWSIEANPLDLDRDTIRVLANAGVNRVSLGAQSFDATALRILERDHSPEQIQQATDRLRTAGISNISLDLIFGSPGQTLTSWEHTLAAALALQPAHVSTYGLTYEKGTRFWSRRLKGEILPVSDELEREMYALAMTILPSAGLAQYELSNFAHPRMESRHNQMYWSLDPFEAFGPGAARYLDGVRSTNHRSVTTWVKRVQAGESPIAESEQLSPEDRAREAIFVGLRRITGVDRAAFQRRTGLGLDELFSPIIEQQRQRGLLEDDGTRIRLSYAGRFLADEVLMAFL